MTISEFLIEFVFFALSIIGLGLQGLQNLQNLQNLPNLAGNPALNTLDMLNLMQFHQLLSLNFMNLAPPLIFGAAAAAQQANTSNDTAGLNLPANLGRSTASMSSVSSNASDIAANANPIAAAQKAQLLQQQAAAAQVVRVGTHECWGYFPLQSLGDFFLLLLNFLCVFFFTFNFNSYSRRQIIKNVPARE